MPTDPKTQHVAEAIYASKGWGHIPFATLPEPTKREFVSYAQAALKACGEWAFVHGKLPDEVAA